MYDLLKLIPWFLIALSPDIQHNINSVEYDLQKIASLLSQNTKFSADRLIFFEELDSTNNWMLQQPEIDGLCCITNHQTAGKGRQGRIWTDDRGGSILMSMGWNVDNEYCSGVSLAAGLAVVKSLKELGVEGIQLKWPNDILFNASKLGGILVERSGNKLVVGLGLNYRLENPLMLSINQPWTDITSISSTCDANELLCGILRNMGEYITDCIAHGFSGFVDEWNSLDAFRGCLVEIQVGPNHTIGINRGIDESAALRIETDNKVQAIHTGDVSLRYKTSSAK
ncbi:MAG: biotin--[acetyl-CoA-carboxylase] ligase [Gammaproteobacteria bacterium]|nr:biotin--[acetyl-CoA-carboxylase] ligase [Gammaproteobacteria bacterium]MCY4217713.1 biotin--[acetyl-CoA-carboxylase] ligase [Gammaproteobacteria bacterium]MCY4274131.1 biotin--[acetyl-CoA-carboxylase] ligase [Gammaproteobacteria bacterium]